MKKIKIFPSALEIRIAEMPVADEFKAVKLTYDQAMSFQSKFTSFEELLTEYGIANRLQVGEFYEGYLAVYHWSGHVEVVRMNGLIRKIAPTVANGILNYRFAENIRAGLAWECIYLTEDSSICLGCFNYVWTFRDCRFTYEVSRMKEVVGDKILQRSYSSDDINRIVAMEPEVVDEELKTKLVTALLTDEKIVVLSDDEDMVLKHYLGGSYYKSFFSEVK